MSTRYTLSTVEQHPKTTLGKFLLPLLLLSVGLIPRHNIPDGQGTIVQRISLYKSKKDQTLGIKRKRSQGFRLKISTVILELEIIMYEYENMIIIVYECLPLSYTDTRVGGSWDWKVLYGLIHTYTYIRIQIHIQHIVYLSKNLYVVSKYIYIDIRKIKTLNSYKTYSDTSVNGVQLEEMNSRSIKIRNHIL